ncbi:prepilin-type N-terminal cleavage/methylation domain-containing protein [Sulfurimonas aquatica]|uniref:Prepilin-type N-terminal cleavage/methylation domain-containing protein n=1 Tax=Sulfurimonas aquatica TaxID=2672570 RepID=A0A975GD89_9BACT|nr:prepilin-type N-terminal cleavage/methylation domain-containing protein [Sulfurimonas aquatica]
MKKAFTMLELVFVIVVIGILAATIIPTVKTNPLQEAAIQLVSHIRYTQHLALVNDQFSTTDTNWYKQRWQIAFSASAAADNQPAYTIYADTSGSSTGDADKEEVALNPENSAQLMTGGYSGDNKMDINHADFIGMKKLNLGLSYGVDSITLSSTCKVSGSTRIAFDHLGRPIKGKLGGASGGGNAEAYESDNLIQDNCIIVLKDADDNNVSIIVRPETGYATVAF